LRPARGELAPQKQANFGGLGAEQLGQGLHVVALARQPRLQIIDILGNDGIDEFGADRFLVLVALPARPSAVRSGGAWSAFREAS
jgi:hypothetical protein